MWIQLSRKSVEVDRRRLAALVGNILRVDDILVGGIIRVARLPTGLGCEHDVLRLKAKRGRETGFGLLHFCTATHLHASALFHLSATLRALFAIATRFALLAVALGLSHLSWPTAAHLHAGAFFHFSTAFRALFAIATRFALLALALAFFQFDVVVALVLRPFVFIVTLAVVALTLTLRALFALLLVLGAFAVNSKSGDLFALVLDHVEFFGFLKQAHRLVEQVHGFAGCWAGNRLQGTTSTERACSAIS